MVRYAVGYRSRAFVTFGAPIAAGDRDVALAQRRARARRGWSARASARSTRCCRRRCSPRRCGRRSRGAISKSRIDRLIDELAARHANLGVTSGRQAIEEAAEPLETRGIVVAERGRFRVRERTRAAVLRAHDRAPARDPRPDRTDARQRVEGLLPPHRAKRNPQEAGVALRHAQADRASRAASSPARRSTKRSRRRARVEARGMLI